VVGGGWWESQSASRSASQSERAHVGWGRAGRQASTLAIPTGERQRGDQPQEYPIFDRPSRCVPPLRRGKRKVVAPALFSLQRLPNLLRSRRKDQSPSVPRRCLANERAPSASERARESVSVSDAESARIGRVSTHPTTHDLRPARILQRRLLQVPQRRKDLPGRHRLRLCCCLQQVNGAVHTRTRSRGRRPEQRPRLRRRLLPGWNDPSATA